MSYCFRLHIDEQETLRLEKVAVYTRTALRFTQRLLVVAFELRCPGSRSGKISGN